MLWRKGIPFIFHECNSFVCLSDYINDNLFSCVFFFLHGLCFLQLSASFLFLWNSLMPEVFFRYGELSHCLLIFKTKKSCLEDLYMCFGSCCWLWALLQYHLTGPLLLRKSNGIYIFTFSLCWLHSPGKDLLVSSLLTPGRYGPGSWDQLSRRQSSHHSAHKLPLKCPCFHCETLLWPELCLVLLTLCFTSLKMTLLFGGEEAVASM